MSLYPVNRPYVPISWIGQLGTQYEFQLDPIRTIYRDIPGVYIFCQSIGGNLWKPLYVGETSSMRRRLTDELDAHHSFGAVLLNGATHLSTLHVSSGLAERFRIETDLRHALRPCCNRQ
ncbi:hypothetical protein [Tardiphaga sp.]|jgi:excinuclease UvrABC nuclease subunit|uniref:hypothetical protein n=1 Tax=Tardiphaga sp. TaxID=1926292 RepID=UPI0037DA1D5E